MHSGAKALFLLTHCSIRYFEVIHRAVCKLCTVALTGLSGYRYFSRRGWRPGYPDSI